MDDTELPAPGWYKVESLSSLRLCKAQNQSLSKKKINNKVSKLVDAKLYQEPQGLPYRLPPYQQESHNAILKRVLVFVSVIWDRLSQSEC